MVLSSIRYALSEIRDHGTDVTWWRDRIQYRINGGFQTRIYPGRDGIDVPAADWDTLLVLDGCRLDLFREVVDRDRFDSVTSIASRASATDEWLYQNFPDTYGDIVYVTANSMVSRHKPDAFHALLEPWRDGFDEERGVVDPAHVTDAALGAHETYPNKRVIVHYTQPHYPFALDPDLQFADMEGPGHPTEGDERALNVWDAIRKGIVTEEEAWAGYARNLEFVLDAIEPLLDVEGRVVVSSDHGNLLGVRTYPVPIPVYGHPQRIRHPDLVTVPWAVVENGRRRIVEGTVEDTSEATDEEIREQLKHLGYAE